MQSVNGSHAAHRTAGTAQHTGDLAPLGTLTRAIMTHLLDVEAPLCALGSIGFGVGLQRCGVLQTPLRSLIACCPATACTLPMQRLSCDVAGELHVVLRTQRAIWKCNCASAGEHVKGV